MSDGNGNHGDGAAVKLAPQGLPVRPGGPLVPGLRRLRDPRRDPAPAARHSACKPENLVFVSGIGCAARFPYYMNTYGVHSIHGRAPAVATGVALARPDLDVWVIGGDGDMLSIGGNHLIHALRRNVNLKILMFNNQIYGLTKGQYSPTSEVGKVTKSTPFGSLDHPFNPISVALGAEATFVARTHDMDRKHMMEMFRRAHEHQGAAFVEMYQNCNVFNDGAFDTILNKDARPDMLIDLKHGEPIRFGADGEHGVVLNEFGEAKIVDVADVGVDRLLVHDEHRADPSLAFALSRLADHPDDADAGRRVPRRRASDVRGEMQRQLVGGGRAQRPRRPRRRCSAPAPTWTVELSRRGRRSVEGAEHHARCAASGAKNVVFCGMRTPATRRGAGLRDRHRAHRIAARRGALVDERRDALRVVAVRHVASGRRGTTSASTTAASVAATAGCSSASAAARTSARGTASARPSRVDEAEPAARSRIARSSASTPSGVFGAGVDDRRTRRRGGRAGRRRRAGRAAGGSARCRAGRRRAPRPAS